MNLTSRREVAVPAERVRALVQDLAGWSRWIPGCVQCAVDPQPDGGTDVTLRVRAPRALSLRLEVEATEQGVRYALVEGDVAAASGTVEVVARGEGSEITWHQELAFPVSVPRPLLRELEDETMPRWLAALASASEAAAG